MAQTQVVIVYSPNQGRRRCVYVPSDDSQVPGIVSHVAAFDSRLGVMVGSMDEYKRLGPDEILKRFLGRPPADHRCLVVNNGAVLAIILADPQLDTHPAGVVMHDPTGQAQIGWTLQGGIPVAPLSTTPHS